MRYVKAQSAILLEVIMNKPEREERLGKNRVAD
jgi:hypothetical protein